MKKPIIIIGLLLGLLFLPLSLFKAQGAESATNCSLCHNTTVSNFNYKYTNDAGNTYIDNNQFSKVNMTGDCKICHNDPTHNSSVDQRIEAPPGSGVWFQNKVANAGALMDPYNPPISPNTSFTTFKNAVHYKHSGARANTDTGNCYLCHGSEGATYSGITYIAAKVDCQMCHKNVAHTAHGDSDSTLKVAPTLRYVDTATHSGKKYVSKQLSCTAANCHNSTAWPAIKRTSDSKQLCVNCHNTARDGYDIDKNGHLKVNGGKKDLNEIHNSNFTTDPQKDPTFNCKDCHQSSSDLGVSTTDLSGYHKSLLQFKDKECTTCHSNNQLPKDPSKNLNVDVIKNATLSNTEKTYCDKCHTLTHLNATTAKTLHASTTLPIISSTVTISGTSTKVYSTEKTCLNCHQSSNIVDEHTNKSVAPLNNCTICHNNPNPQPKSKTLTKDQLNSAIMTGGANCNSCHDVNVKHQNNLGSSHTSNYFSTQTALSNTSLANVDCLQCHKNVLDQEHLTKNAKSTGKLMTCDSCHNNPKVMGKIKNGTSGIFDPLNPPITNCISCHDSGTLGDDHKIHPNDAVDNHTVKFNTVSGLTCNNCHSGMDTISNGHVNKKDSNGNTYMSCNSCHSDSAKLPKDSTKTVKSVIDQIIADPNKKAILTCGTCHDIHIDTNTIHGTTYMNDPKPFDCSQCHKNTLNNEHGGTNINTGKVMDCNTCHSDNAQLPNQKGKVSTIIDQFKNVANSTNNNLKAKCSDCHNVHPEPSKIHTSTYVANQQVNCANCHKNTLNDEHASHVDVNGIAYNCATCHNNSRIEVRTAILNSKTNCDACHAISHNDPTKTNTIHTTSFVDNQFINCNGCHQSTLSEEHLSRVKSDGSKYNCNSCHENPDIKLIINSSTQISTNYATIMSINTKSTKVSNKTKCNTCHTIHKDANDAHWKQYNYDSKSQCLGCHKIHPKN